MQIAGEDDERAGAVGGAEERAGGGLTLAPCVR
jgi:hypothetical protein